MIRGSIHTSRLLIVYTSGMPALNFKQKATLGFATSIILSFALLSFFVSADAITRCLHLAVILCAFAAGWVVGISLSPYDAKERDQFPKIAAAASAFVSGYLVSKLDRAIEALFATPTLFEPAIAFRVLAAFAVFCTSLIVTYVFRTYA